MMKQSQILLHGLYLTFLVGLISSCDVVDLILYEKEVTVIREVKHLEIFDVYGTSFDIQNLISKEELADRIEMPEGGGIRSINIESIMLELTSGTENNSEEITLDVYAATSELEIYFFVNKAVLPVTNDSFVNPGLISKQDLDGVEELFLKTITSADSLSIPSFNLGIRNNGPVNSLLDIDVEVTINFIAEIYYCALVPGNSALPECAD